MGRHVLREDRLPVEQRKDPRPIPRWLLWAIPVGFVVLLGIGLWIAVLASSAEGDRDVARGETAATAQQAQDAVDPVLRLCALDDDVARVLRERGACDLAQKVQQAPIPPVPAKDGARGPGPTREEVAAEVAQQIPSVVAAYIAAHPPADGKSPSREELTTLVTAAVASYMVANPPADGRPPTAAEIAEQVRIYFAANPPPAGEPGKDGDKGDKGDPPSAEEIDASVARHLAEHPIPPGPSCPSGSTQLPVTYGDGTAGVGCVLDEQPPPVPDPEPDPEEDPGG